MVIAMRISLTVLCLGTCLAAQPATLQLRRNLGQDAVAFDHQSRHLTGTATIVTKGCNNFKEIEECFMFADKNRSVGSHALSRSTN